MPSNLIIPITAKFGGIPLAQLAKQERKQQTPAPPMPRQQPLAGNIILLSPRNPGMTQEEAVAAANSQRKILVTNLWADDDLVNKDGLNQRNNTYGIWTGLMVAYEKPGVALKDSITYTDSSSKITYTFNVPPQFKGEKNCILCVAHGFLANGTPTFQHKQVSGGTLIEVADPSLISLIKNYNKDDGWYLPEPQFGIPVGASSKDTNQAARYSYRINSDSYIGLVARVDVVDGGGQRYVNADGLPSFLLGVLAYSEKV